MAATIRHASTASDCTPAGALTMPQPLVGRAREDTVDAGRRASRETPVLELKGLSKRFGGLHAVRGITFRIMPGERTAIIGPNGAGKTTLFNLITGIFPASSGQVLLFGRD